jgi:hypothetical protein
MVADSVLPDASGESPVESKRWSSTSSEQSCDVSIVGFVASGSRLRS